MKRLITLISVFLFWAGSSWGQNLSEGFENASPVPPEGWIVTYANPTPPSGNLVTHTTSFYYAGTRSFRFSSFSSGSPYDQYLITPHLNVTPGDQTFSFYYRKYTSGTETYRVGWSSTGTAISDFTWSANITNASTTWQQYIKTDLPDGTKYVAIHYLSVYQYYLYIDQVVGPTLYVSPLPPNCATIVSPPDAGTNILASATLNWASGGGGPTGYKLYFGTNTPPTNIVNGTNLGNVTTYDPTPDLSYSTLYYWKVVAYNANGDATECSIWSFTTIADPTINTFPYNQGFEGATFPPPGWLVIDNNADGDKWILSTTYPRTGSQCARILTDYNSANDDYLVTPPIVLSGNQELKFWVRAQSAGEPDEISILLSTTTPSPAAFTTVLMPSTPVNTTTYVEYTLNLSAYSGTVYISFTRKNTPADGWYLYLDDVLLRDIPSCIAPTGQTVSNITTSGADLGWTDATGTNWDLYIVPAGDPAPIISTPPTVNDNSSNPVSWSGGTDNESYDWYVRTDCGQDNADVSSWTGPSTFTTNPLPYTLPFTETFESTTALPGGWRSWQSDGSGYSWIGTTGGLTSGCAYSGYYGTIWLISNEITVPASGSVDLNFYQKNTYSSDYILHGLYYSTTGAENTGDWTAIVADLGVAPTSWTVSNTYTLTGYPGTTLFIAFEYEGSNADGWYVDDVHMEVTPSCPAPTSLTTANVTNSAADIGWTSTETAWEYVYGESPVSPPGEAGTPTTLNPTSISGLSSNTNYQFYVRSDCGDDVFSSWSGPHAFTTLCDAFTVPFSENFDAVTPPALPNCWFKKVSSTSSSSVVETYSYGTPHSSPNEAELYNSYDGSAVLLLITPQVSLPLNTLQVRFWAKGGSGYTLGIGTMTDPANAATYTQLTSQSLTSTYTEYTVSFFGYSGTDPYIAFKHGLGGTYRYIYIDNVTVEILPSCPMPSSLTTTNITSTTADLNWTNGGTEALWNVKYGAPGFDPLTVGTLIEGINSHPYTLNPPLTPNTSFDWYVKADCGSGSYSSWAGPKNFTTTISPLSNPTACDLNMSIPDNACGTSELVVPILISAAPGTQLGTDVVFSSISIIIEHTYDGDLDLYLISPDNVIVELSTDNGGGGDNYGDPANCPTDVTTFRMDATSSITSGTAPFIGSYIPEGNLADFHDGSNPIGVWKIQVCDDAGGDIGTVDYISIVFAEPTACPPPAGLITDNITATSAQLAWSYGPLPDSFFDVFWGPSGFDPETEGTLITNVTSPYTLNPPLNPGISYDWYVRANCDFDQPKKENFWIQLYDDGEIGALSGGAPVDDPGEDGMFYFYQDWGVPWHNIWWYNGPVDPNRMKIIRMGFWVQRINQNAPADITYVVNWSTADWPGPGFPTPSDTGYIERSPTSQPVQVLPTDPEHLNGQWVELYYVITDFNPEWVSVDIWGQNVQITHGLTPPPAESALFSWWNQDPQPGGILLHECLPKPQGGSSSWAGPVTFATACSLLNVPVNEKFDATPLGEVPLCWTRETNTSDWVVAENMDVYSPPRAIVNYYDFYSPKDDWFFTPELNLIGGTTYDVSFFIQAPGWEGVGEKLEVKWGDDPSAIGMTGGTIYENEDIQLPDYVKIRESFTPITDGVYYIGWHAYSDVNIDYIVIDDIAIEALFIWTGNSGNNWNDPNNWDRGIAPDALGNVLIPAIPETPGVFPVISSGLTIECGDLHIQDGAIVTVEVGGILKVRNP
jgi:subtilisin-like proprotein convertase family protein